MALAPVPQELPRGRVTEKIVCRESPGQSYALFLPSSYDAARPAPVLYMLDARGRALVAIERFREAAEEHGWILVSSYNTRSDTQDDPNTPAVQAMWKDTHERLTIDDRRVSLTGFSGGARASITLALHKPLGIAGVIGCGAGFADDTAPIKETPAFAYFGIVGNRDFNYYEMRELDEKLARAGARYRIEVFDGEHDWPPAALAREALAWLEVEAMRSGTRPRDAAAIAALYAQDLARGRVLEAEGRAADAFVRYGWIARDFRGLTDTGQAEAKAVELGRSTQVRKALEDGRRRDERDRATLRDLSRKLSRAFAASELPPAGLVAGELKIPALRKKASGADSAEERLSAERILANLRVQTSFYAPRTVPREEGCSARLPGAVDRGRDRPGRPVRLLQPRLRLRANRPDLADAQGAGPRRRKGVPALRDDRHRPGLCFGARQPGVSEVAHRSPRAPSGSAALSATNQLIARGVYDGVGPFPAAK